MEENKLYAIFDDEHCFYCYLILESVLSDSEVNEIIKNIYYNLINHEGDFSESFECELKKLKSVNVKSIIYKDIKILCV